MKRYLSVLIVSLVACATLRAATPPDLVNFQGVLRDSSGSPLDGSFDVVFAFYTLGTGGSEILLDAHTGAGALDVVNGLFNVPLGSGVVIDGSGPGIYVSLDDVFADFSGVWLEIRVGSETLSPRIRVGSAAYALNSSRLGGRPGDEFLDTGSGAQTKSGTLSVGSGTGPGEAQARLAIGGSGGNFLAYRSIVLLADDDVGINSSGASVGGVFHDSNSSAYVELANDDEGMRAYGDSWAGYFQDLTDNSFVRLGHGHWGLSSYGDYQAFRNGGGGLFVDATYSGEAYVAHGNEGIYAEGGFAGGEFRDTSPDGAATLLAAWSSLGVAGYGLAGGGFFQDNSTGTWTYTAYGAQSTAGPGTKNFVQNHPEDPEKVVVYTSLEGDHPGTFTRGTARTERGRARVPLADTFRLVTHPDIGLTAHVTPRGTWADLYVESVSTEEIVVASRDGEDATFDYVVYGVRIGFETFPAVQPKAREARLPVMASLTAMIDDDPSLRATTALARFESMRAARGLSAETDLSRAEELKAAIGTYDPARDAEPFPEDRGIQANAAGDRSDAADGAGSPVDAAAARDSSERAPTRRSSSPDARADALPIDRTARGTWLTVAEPVDAGDVLVLDPAEPGSLRRGVAIADPNVVAVAVGPSRAIEGGGLEAPVADGRYATVRVDAGYGEIRPGDRLVASPTPGHAMLGLDAENGTVLGTALDGLATGTGTVRVLLMLR